MLGTTDGQSRLWKDLRISSFKTRTNKSCHRGSQRLLWGAAKILVCVIRMLPIERASTWTQTNLIFSYPKTETKHIPPRRSVSLRPPKLRIWLNQTTFSLNPKKSTNFREIFSFFHKKARLNSENPVFFHQNNLPTRHIDANPFHCSMQPITRPRNFLTCELLIIQLNFKPRSC